MTLERFVSVRSASYKQTATSGKKTHLIGLCKRVNESVEIGFGKLKDNFLCRSVIVSKGKIESDSALPQQCNLVTRH
jgi:hypothetical protein